MAILFLQGSCIYSALVSNWILCHEWKILSGHMKTGVGWKIIVGLVITRWPLHILIIYAVMFDCFTAVLEKLAMHRNVILLAIFVVEHVESIQKNVLLQNKRYDHM